MSDADILILDNNVLSSFESAGWLDTLAFWTPGCTLIASELVWEEFVVEHEIKSPPDWLSVETVDLNQIHAPAIGQLSRQDWSCVGLLESSDMGRLVTNDSALKDVAEDRGHAVEWGTSFVIRTFRECGISTVEFKEGVDTYIEDVYLPGEVTEELRNTEKRGQ